MPLKKKTASQYALKLPRQCNHTNECVGMLVARFLRNKKASKSQTHSIQKYINYAMILGKQFHFSQF